MRHLERVLRMCCLLPLTACSAEPGKDLDKIDVHRMALAGLQPGDVNGDGKVTIDDATVIAAYLGGNNPQPFHAQVADVDCNGTINMADATKIAQYTAGTVVQLGCDAVAIMTQPRDGQRFLAGHKLAVVGTAIEPDGRTLPPESFRWELLRGTAVLASCQGAVGNLAIPADTTQPEQLTVRLSATGTSGVTVTTERNLTVYPWQGQIDVGVTFETNDYQTTVLYFTVPTEDVDKYYHVELDAGDVALMAFVQRGDRGGYAGRHEGVASDSLTRAAMITDPYRRPRLEFRAWKPGEHTLVLQRLTCTRTDWMAPMCTPPSPDVTATYKITRSSSSTAADKGESVHIVRDFFPSEFEVDNVLVQKASFDFTSLQKGFGNVYRSYRDFIGGEFTRDGTTIGVTYPPDDKYSLGADCASPIRIGSGGWTMRTMGAHAFEHELAHIFSMGYPYVYSIQDGSCQTTLEDGKIEHCNNTEPIVDYFISRLLAPDGAGMLELPAYARWEQEMFGMTNQLRSPKLWHAALVDRGMPALLRRISGGWRGMELVFRRYSAEYAGNQTDVPAVERARTFYQRLTESIPFADKQLAFRKQLRKWGVPFADQTLTYEDADGDGIVAGLDPDDHDPTSNIVDEECQGTKCVPDGVDQNLDGWVDGGILLANETIALGDHARVAPAGAGTSWKRTTRRKLYLEADRSLTIDTPADRHIVISGVRGDTPFGNNSPLSTSNSAVNHLKVRSTLPGIFTFEFMEEAPDALSPTTHVTYTTTMGPAEPPAKGDANGDGFVNFEDVVATSSYASGKPPSPFYKDAADVDCNGVINDTDTQQIYEYTLGTRPSLTCNQSKVVVSNRWDTGYCVEVTVFNNGNQLATGWTVTMATPSSSVYTSWNADIQRGGGTLTASGVGWNKTIAAKGQTAFGFCANTPSGAQVTPTVTKVDLRY